MALINCPECGKQVSDTAPSCPHCGYQLKGEANMSHTQISKPKKKNSALTTILVVIAIILFIIYVVSSMGGGSNSNKSSSPSHDNILAYNYSKDFVKQNLKSPSTAEFPGTSEKIKHTTYLGGDKYKIESWADSQNSFGAMVRTKFSCTITFVGDKVRCEDLVIEE